MAKRKEIRKSHPDDSEKNRSYDANRYPLNSINETLAKIEIFGQDMVEKRVKACANSGRVYLPPEWIGHKVKIIRID